MPRKIKAFQFWMRPAEGPTDPVVGAISAIDATNRSFEFTQHGKSYLAYDLAWHTRNAVLTGTVYLLRHNDLPAAIRDGRAGPLPIPNETDLGEPMCFAFHPGVGAAVIQYAHTGPRHPVLVPIISRFLPNTPMLLEPVIRTDMLVRLRQKQFFRGIEFTLTDPKGIQELRTAGGSVGRAIDMLGDVGGVTIHVEISMGHTRGQGLIANATRGLAERLAHVATREISPDEHGDIGTLKVRGSDGADTPVEELDLLRAREAIAFEADEADRSIDTAETCRKLSTELVARLDNLRTQMGAVDE